MYIIYIRNYLKKEGKYNFVKNIKKLNFYYILLNKKVIFGL